MTARRRDNLMSLLFGGIILLEYLADRLLYGGMLQAVSLGFLAVFCVLTIAANLRADKAGGEKRAGRSGRRVEFWIALGLAVLLAVVFAADPSVRRRLFWYQAAVLLLILGAVRLLQKRFPRAGKYLVPGMAAGLFYLPLRGELAAVWETDQDLSEICIE